MISAAIKNSVMPGLYPGIHAVPPADLQKGVDGRVEPGHDDEV